MDESKRLPREPEIIPPGQPLPHQRSAFWTGPDASNLHRVYVRQIGVRQIGPLGGTLLVLGIGAALVLGFFFLIGTVIISLAAIGALTIIGVVAGILHGPPRPRP